MLEGSHLAEVGSPETSLASAFTIREVADIYAELRPVAAHLLRFEERGPWMQATSLVHATLLRIMGKDWRQRVWKNRAHFFEEFARNMRYVLIDNARKRARRARLTCMDPVAFDDVVTMYRDRPDQLVEIADLLDHMRDSGDLATPSRKLQVASHLIFGGRKIPEVAVLLEVSQATVKRDWVAIKSWLACRLGLATTAGVQKDTDHV